MGRHLGEQSHSHLRTALGTRLTVELNLELILMKRNDDICKMQMAVSPDRRNKTSKMMLKYILNWIIRYPNLNLWIVIYIWQGVVWIEIKGAEIHSIVLAMKTWFLCLLGLNMIVWNLIIQKKSKKTHKKHKKRKNRKIAL